MTWPGSGAEPAAVAPCGAAAPAGIGTDGSGDRLQCRLSGDGSPTLWSERFGESFHCGSGALAEARHKFVAPAQLERFSPGSLLRVLDVGVGLAYNSASLLEAARALGLRLQWWGCECDPRPLAWALADPGFRSLWQPATLRVLEQLRDQGSCRLIAESDRHGAVLEGRWLAGDARRQLPQLLAETGGCCDLILHDAFSPGRCPELWSLEFLSGLARLLAPNGRLLTYSSAAGVRQGLRLAGLELAAIQVPASGQPATNGRAQARWSLGTAASPRPLPCQPPLRALTAMEWEHLACRAAEPYRDPSGCATAEAILAARRLAQSHSSAGSSSAWRRRWGIA